MNTASRSLHRFSFASGSRCAIGRVTRSILLYPVSHRRDDGPRGLVARAVVTAEIGVGSAAKI
jgi:hypothetical protein